MLFKSRRQAGKLLAEELRRQKIKPDVVFGLTRGGVAVAAEAAKILGVKLRPLVVRKIGAPGNPEFAVGAAAEGAVWWDEETLKRWGLDKKWQKQQILAKKLEILECIRKIGITKNIRRPASRSAGIAFGDARPELQRGEPSPKSGNIVLIDDGAATGISMMAALSAAKTPLSGVAAIKTIVALPVASTEAAEMLRQAADQVVILHEDFYLEAVGAYYRQFKQMSWDRIKRLLKLSYETNQKTN